MKRTLLHVLFDLHPSHHVRGDEVSRGDGIHVDQAETAAVLRPASLVSL
ncbi:MAG: hypothetical protein WDN28_20610 [Chthoniobacter sp.]